MIKTAIKFDVLMIELLTIKRLYFLSIFLDSFYIYLIAIIIYKDE